MKGDRQGCDGWCTRRHRGRRGGMPCRFGTDGVPCTTGATASTRRVVGLS